MAIISALSKIQQASQKHISEDRTYMDIDGFVCCSKCNQRREMDVPSFKTQIPLRVGIMCNCQKNAYEAEQHEKGIYETISDVEDIKRNGIEEKNLMSLNFNIDKYPNSNESQISRRYVENFDIMYKNKFGLIFCGDVGNGKTFYSACIANELANRRRTVLITSLPLLHTKITANYGENKMNVMNMISNVELLVLDDVGTERDTPTMTETIFSVINARYNSGKPLIISTNLTPMQLCEPPDIEHKRIYSRIVERSEFVIMTNPNQRKSNDNRQEIKNILGVR